MTARWLCVVLAPFLRAWRSPKRKKETKSMLSVFFFIWHRNFILFVPHFCILKFSTLPQPLRTGNMSLCLKMRRLTLQHTLLTHSSWPKQDIPRQLVNEMDVCACVHMHVRVVCMCVYLSSRYILIYISLISDLGHPFTYFGHLYISVYLYL